MNHGLFRVLILSLFSSEIALRLSRGAVLAYPLYYFIHKLVFALKRCNFRRLNYRAARRSLHNNSTDRSISLKEVDHPLGVNEILIGWHV